MPPVLRKRKAPEQPPPPPPAKRTTKATKASAKKAEPAKTAKVAKAAPAKKEEPAAAAAAPAAAPTVGDVIDLEGFGGEIETHDGKKVTLKGLVEESKGGVVLFTYPKASTPGCTKQVCFFRDSYEELTKTGFAIYGLSADSGKANTTFKNKYQLTYPLLCDGDATLIAAIGLKKNPRGTQRGVFVVDKSGKVLAAEPGSPAGTVETVRALVGEADGGGAGEEEDEEKAWEKSGVNGEEKKEEKEEKKEEEKKEEEKDKKKDE